MEGGISDGGILRAPITAKEMKKMVVADECAPGMFDEYGDLFELCDPQHLYLKKDSSKFQASARLSGAIATNKRPMCGRVYDADKQKHCTTRIIGTVTHATLRIAPASSDLVGNVSKLSQSQ
ncbi:hypothetical protein RvY_18339 [Ramazzottius varieornatus]|uniref:Uncharacterized protein n=1 Tax=Ramazzottius varieornatus TaxID=947166 RepID=A0A1D1W5E1_RAMVA|nr:hypothetical protein RvY_18339 [Ramazzottius varieornatus]